MRNFDAFIAEIQDKGPEFQLYGKRYKLPASPSLKAILLFIELQEKSEEEATKELLLPAFRALFENVKCLDNLEENPADCWLNSGMSLAVMIELLKWALEQYGIAQTEGTLGKK